MVVVQTRFFLNIFLVVVLLMLLTAFMLRNTYTFSDTTILSTSNTPKSANQDSILIPLKDIMRSPVTLSQDDPNLIRKIRSEFLISPSKLPYSLTGDTDDPSKGQSEKIRELLGHKKDGFFVECGALDGETRSNTLVFEKVLGWKGILIEGDPKNFNLVLKKQRKAWAVPACLSTYPYPNMVMFSQRFNVGKISQVPLGQKSHRSDLVEVQCLPLYSILLALNRTSVDYFSLDVEGHELEVLKTLPWDKINITALSVEFIHGKDGKAALRDFMEKQGYEVYAEVTFVGSLANDFIFYHPRLLNKRIA